MALFDAALGSIQSSTWPTVPALPPPLDRREDNRRQNPSSARGPLAYGLIRRHAAVALSWADGDASAHAASSPPRATE
uniref:Uncharacterized protein n=1 Tax=Oryza nivara TaxID=4536 RepID=A0A0E0H035_ORYNI